MADTAAHLVEHVLPEQPIRQWVLSFPYPLRFLFATRPAVLTQVLGIVYRAITTFLVRRAGLRSGAGARTGAVTLTAPARALIGLLIPGIAQAPQTETGIR